LQGWSQRPQVYISSRINKSPPQTAAIPLYACSCIGMSTERQKQASRANGSKSRGPVTSAGKLASSRNALKHGMFSATIVLEGESTDNFYQLVANLFDEFQPQTPFEESLIENMALARWRHVRICGLEKAGMDYEIRRQAEMSASIAAENNVTRAAIAFRALSDDSRSLDLIKRYDSSFERQYYRAHRCFLEVRDSRTPPGECVISERTPEVVANKPSPSGGTCGYQPRSSGAPVKSVARPVLSYMGHPVPRIVSVRNVHSRRTNLKPIQIRSEERPGTCSSSTALLMSKYLGLIVVLWACCSAAAATLQQLSLDQMTQSATAIVRARVTGSSASFTGSTIYTHYKLQTSETFKGASAPEVMLPGGAANGYRQSFPGVPALQAGTEYVLFLWKSKTTGITHVIGLSQGIFNVTPQTDGSVQVDRPLIGETMLDAAGRPVRDQAVRMQLADMKAQISRAPVGGANNK
jgi:hypothetical protein